jgi:phosphatidylglycerol---prolipoprotein diacylglyceryl transferase
VPLGSRHPLKNLMQQVLFTIPLFKESFPPDGIPMYGFGAMLFICFVTVTLWGSRRAKKTADMPPERFQDMVIWLFVSGIVGARVLYMIQYSENFPDKSIGGQIAAFFKIWEGGIIFYGSALGGALGYGLFYWFVLRRLKIDGWKLADAAAPLLALGLAIGRIGCYLNGCCWGQVACEECQTVPLGAAHFPLLPAHARPELRCTGTSRRRPAFRPRPPTATRGHA